MRTFALTIIATLLTLTTLFSQDCGTVSYSCITSTVANIQPLDEGIEITVRVALDGSCPTNNAVSHVSVGLPEAMKAISPLDNEIYVSGYSGIGYVIENMSSFPFHSIKFNVQEGLEGIKPGEADEFTFFIPHGSEVTSLPVEVKIGSTSNIMEVEISEECISLMPVELTSFEGSEKDNGIVLSWSTATEENSSHFEIQKSKNGQDWRVIGEVKSHGNSVEEKHYAFNDGNVTEEVNYYRMRMVDLDETFEYSETIVVRTSSVSDSKMVEVNIFPNPTANYLNLDFKGASNADMNIRIVNGNGSAVYNGTGTDVERIDVSEYATGTYFLIVDNGKEVQTKRFIKAVN